MSGSNIADKQIDAAFRPREPARVLSWVSVVVLTLAAVLMASWLLYRREAGQIGDRQAQVEVVRVSLLAQLLRAGLEPVAEDLRLLADGDGLQAYLRAGQEADLQRAIRRARFFSVTKPEYDQVRYIDQTGREIIRINQGGRVVVGPQLQNKSDRDYFRQASTLAAGDLYLSAIDLNVENGRIETPMKPVLRFAMAVFDTAGQRRGIYIINYLGAGIIERLQQAAGTAGHRFRLLNANGYWLKAEHPDEEWGFMLAGGGAHTLATRDPVLWARIQREPTGQFLDANGLFTWQRLPTVEFAKVSAGHLRTENPYLIVASAISGSEWTALFAGLRQITMVGAAGLIVLALCSLWLFRGRLHAVRDLRQANEDLEARVRSRTEEIARSHELLRYREQLLEETGHLAKVGGWDFDPVSGAGRWTAEVARIHDLDVTVEPNRQLGLQFYPGESRTRLEAALQQAMAQGTAYDLELEFISARGEHKWVRTIGRPAMQDGKVVRLRGALQDVTDRKLIEQRLQAQLQRLHLLEQTTRAIGERQDLASILNVVIRTVEVELPLDFGCICRYDPVDRDLIVAAVGSASLALARPLSMTESERIPIDENGLSRCVRGQLVHEPDIEAVPFAFPQRLLAGGLRTLVAAPLQIESQVFGVLIAARRKPHSFSSGECEFLRQLSEHVALAAHQAQLHEALQTAYDDLRSSQQAVMQHERLRVLGQMASGIAHDINNAISPITLYTDALLDSESGLSDRARNALQTIQRAVGDVAETVARLREFYRQREVQTELRPVDLNALVSQVVELTRARWQTMPQQRGTVIELKTRLAPDVPAVQGIESEIREALINLVFNAVDAMPSGGVLTLHTRPGAARHTWVEVADTGIGMDEDTRRRCLEPFFTTKGERGTGLGLGMVYGVMQRHGGEIEIESAPGAGTTVRLSFASAEASRPATEPSLEVTTGLTVLLIDDDPILLKSLREILELDGHTVMTANGGQAGIELFRAQRSTPGQTNIGIVITDLGMPHVDGRSVASAVKEASPGTPVILLTGWGERLLAEGDAPAHVDRVLSKPPRLREIRTALSELTKST
jgi:signal transduction histidine kinase/ActR/RegA family two-component response regulator/PAS domain-containing protein